jgi:hypothetical protein
MTDKEIFDELDKYIKSMIEQWEDFSGCDNSWIDVQYGKTLAAKEILEYLQELCKNN